MAFTSATEEYSGSYISGTVELYSSSSTYTTVFAPSTYMYSGSVLTGTVESFFSSNAYTTVFAPSTYRYNGSEIINTNKVIITVPAAGPSSHSSKPIKL